MAPVEYDVIVLMAWAFSPSVRGSMLLVNSSEDFAPDEQPFKINNRISKPNT
jgi:hypothetical protein